MKTRIGIDALDWLAAMTSHIPDLGEQMVHYYGFYSNASRGLRQKEKVEPKERKNLTLKKY